MENKEVFSEEMMQMYSSLLMKSNTIALNNMLATISSMQTKVPINPDIFVQEAAQQLNDIASDDPSKSIASPAPVNSSDKIPIDEIECDIGILVAKSFKHYLKLSNGDLGKGAFRSFIESLCVTPLYKISPKDTSNPQRGTKRKSAGPSLTQTALFASEDNGSGNEEEQSIRKKTKTELSDGSESQLCGVKVKADGNESQLCEVDAELRIITEKLHKSAENLNIMTEHVIQCSSKSSFSYISRRKAKHIGFSSAEVEMRFNRLREIQRRKPKIDVDVSKLPYNSNMRRYYPTPLRSAEAQKRRDKNTIAARVSRVRNKFYEQSLQKKSTEMLVENINWKRKLACNRVYANKLIETLGLEQVDFDEMWEAFVKEKLEKEAKEKLNKETKEKRKKKDDGAKKLEESET